MPAAAFSMARPPATEPVKLTMVDLARAEQLFGLGMVEHDVLEQALRQAGLVEGLLETFADKQRLRGVLEDHRVAGHQRRHDGVDGRQE